MSKRSAGQGGVCGRVLHLLQPFGEFAARQDSPRPSGTPLINAGGKGIVLLFGLGIYRNHRISGESATGHPICHPERRAKPEDKHNPLAPRIYEGGARRAGGVLPQYECAAILR